MEGTTNLTNPTNGRRESKVMGYSLWAIGEVVNWKSERKPSRSGDLRIAVLMRGPWEARMLKAMVFHPGKI